MPSKRRLFLPACLAFALGASCLSASAADASQQKVISKITGVAADPNWAEENAYTLGVQAYAFAFPWYYNQLVRWLWSQPPRGDATQTPSRLGSNQLWHSRSLATAAYRDGGTPNNDTLYSVAWVDVTQEPMILSVPAVKDRYYSFCMTAFDSDNFGYVGTRATGTEAGHYLIAGPNWKGTVPAGVTAATPAHTNVFLLLGRTAVTEAEVTGRTDLGAVHALQDQYRLTPLSLWGKPAGASPSASPALPWGPYPAKTDPLAVWKTINRALTESPPPARDQLLMRMFAKVGIGPGLDVEQVDEPTRRGLIRALETGKRMVTGAGTYLAGTTRRNGWSYQPAHLGRYGQTGDFLGRAGPQSLAGLSANDPIEAIYVPTVQDGDGQPLTGAYKYVLRFGPNEMPPVNAFWSATTYGMDFNLIANPINRYSLGDRSPLKRDPDGGITIYVQRDHPGPEREANWLPVGEDAFKITLRLYLPKAEALDGRWSAPPIRRAQ